MPLARSAALTSLTAIDGSRSIVPTTADRFAGSATNGVAHSRASAHEYSVAADVRLRSTHQSSPPLSSIQRIWSSIRISVATAGVLYVWSERLLVSAMPRSSEAGSPPVARRQAFDPVDRGGGARRDPEPAVGREALLGGEVVDVDVVRRPTPARRRPTWRRRRRGRRRSRQGVGASSPRRWMSRCG